jgi:hypothetical protein
MTAAAASQTGCSATPAAPRTRLGIRRRRPLLGTLGSLVAVTAAAFPAYKWVLYDPEECADGFYVSITRPAIGQADQFLKLMRAAGY